LIGIQPERSAKRSTDRLNIGVIGQKRSVGLRAVDSIHRAAQQARGSPISTERVVGPTVHHSRPPHQSLELERSRTRLLHRVSKLMRQQMLTRRRPRSVLSGIEDNVLADGEGAGVDRSG